MESILKTNRNKEIIVDEQNVMKKYGKDRHTDILYIDEEEEIDEEELI